MIIDFHTHAFPNNIAERALNTLKQRIKIEPCTDGTLEDLSEKTKLSGIDYSVVCNIATKSSQQSNVNMFAKYCKANYKNLIPLGSIHPDSENKEDTVIDLKQNGFVGIKIHPDYMGYDIDSGKFNDIFELCSYYGLFVITHSGFDVASPDHIHANINGILKVISDFPNLKLIAAHFGCNCMWNEVLDVMCGKNLWIDTSLALVEKHEKTILENILNSHDSEKILFGSDSPWCSAYDNVKFIESFNISEERKDKIFYKNAIKLLKL